MDFQLNCAKLIRDTLLNERGISKTFMGYTLVNMPWEWARFWPEVAWWRRTLEFNGPRPCLHTLYLAGMKPFTSSLLHGLWSHYNDVTMSAMPSQITSLAIVYSILDSGADQRIHQSSASLAFVRGIHRSPVNFPHKRPVTRKMFPFDDVIMWCQWFTNVTKLMTGIWLI